MSHTLEALLDGRPVNEKAIAKFLVRTMMPETREKALGRITSLSTEDGPTLAMEIFHFGTPSEFWPEASHLDPQKLQAQLVRHLTELVPLLP